MFLLFFGGRWTNFPPSAPHNNNQNFENRRREPSVKRLVFPSPSFTLLLTLSVLLGGHHTVRKMSHRFLVSRTLQYSGNQVTRVERSDTSDQALVVTLERFAANECAKFVLCVVVRRSAVGTSGRFFEGTS